MGTYKYMRKQEEKKRRSDLRKIENERMGTSPNKIHSKRRKCKQEEKKP